MGISAEEDFKRQLKYCNIDKYHEMGFTGKGITILNHEANTGHAYMTSRILKTIAPDANVIEASVTSSVLNGRVLSYKFNIAGKSYELDEMYEAFKPNIMSVSFSGRNEALEKLLIPYQEKGLVICCSTGNDGSSKGVNGRYSGIALNIGEVYFQNANTIILTPSSGRREIGDVHFVAFTGDGTGTSAACPFFVATVALFMQQYGKMNQEQLKSLLPAYCTDLGDKGLDAKFGNGIFVLPLKGDINMNNKHFDDVELNAYYAEAINWAFEKGIINGFENGIFRPDEPITRGQMCVILKRFYEQCAKG